MPWSPLLRCPLCQAPFTPSEEALVCTAGHHFDRARQGYYHLLPVQRKRSRAPGDNPAMVQARRRFLDAGHYRPFSTRLAAEVQRCLPGSAPRLLDCGCGEGYYTALLHRALSSAGQSPEVFGLDISKAAVKAACQRERAVHWLVASVADIPLVSGAFDGLVCLFSHLAPAEYRRLLRHDGYLWVATTGPEHLIELRRLIYPQVKRQFFDPAPALAADFERCEQQSVQFRFELEEGEMIRDLLAMTPHQWRASAEARQTLERVSQLTLSADIQLHRFRLRPEHRDQQAPCEV